MDSVLAFYSSDPSWYPREVYSFYSVKLFEKNENKRQRDWESPSRKERFKTSEIGTQFTWHNNALTTAVVY